MKRYLKINSNQIIDISKITTIFITSDNCMYIVFDNNCHYKFSSIDLVFKDERCAKEFNKIIDNDDKRNYMRNAMLEIMYYSILYNKENVQEYQYCEEEIKKYISGIKSEDGNYVLSTYNPFKFIFLEDYINAKNE